ncbi:MAG TPA: hypothetical protein VD930_13420 [Gemmatimonadales bacterium]|nr:hypothetical protein [Gemmatimonadales bacterium]
MKLLRGVMVGLSMAAPGTALAAQTSAPAARDTVQAPGAHYRAGGVHRFFLGSEYRRLWSTPVTAPILDLRTYAGGLRPVSKGGGKQTKSLLLEARDGRQFFFRAVDKDASVLLPSELRPTVAGRVVRDQTSSAFPTAPPVVAVLLEAAGIPHAEEELFVLPRSAELGAFQTEFGGLMGFLQERIGGAEGPPSRWGGASEIIGSDSLIARTSRTSNDRVDARAFLAARLFDLFIGDWDRHRDQWVWLRFGNEIPRLWKPVPRDRDQAFAKYDGFLFYFARQTAPQLTNFGESYPYIPGATWNGRDLDRRYLVELGWPVWDSVAGALQSRLSDSVIARALRALPPEHYRLEGQQLASELRSRRDGLHEAARTYYRLLAEEVDVHGTEQPDEARLVRLPKDSLQLTLTQAGSREPYFTRRFSAEDTKEVRLFLGGGNDSAVAGGAGGGIRARILAEEGRDYLVDSVRSGSEVFYDDETGPSRTEGFSTKVDRRPYHTSQPDPEAVAPRDWGHRWAVNPLGSYGPDMGALLGASVRLTSYGFRKYPYSTRHRLRAGFATGPKTYRADYLGEFRRENSGSYAELLLRASGIDVINFHGFGNDISAPGDREFYRVTQDAFGIQPSLVFSLGSRSSLRVGPLLKYVSTDDRPGRFLSTLGDVYGAGSFGELGANLTLRHDSRDRPGTGKRGLLFEIGGTLYPPVWDVDSTFGELHGQAITYLSARAPLDPTLALRVGAKKVWGQFPYFESAFIGDPATVRLGRENRYAGDASAYGSAELRLSLAHFDLVLPTRFGVFGLADAGRVFVEGESSDTWHTAFGGGVSLSYLEQAYTLSVALASGDERTAVYVQAGYGF